VRVTPPVQKLVHFRKLNLIGNWPMQGPFDVIFCRNVVIYFAPESKKTLIERFAELQQPGSHLVVGHSENLTPITDRYAPIGRTVYERC
jgi:chemotaxis protein methyltransferase CheR